jgi:hypothetical protein
MLSGRSVTEECDCPACTKDVTVSLFYLHLIECGWRTNDEEGVECETLGAAEKLAIDAARDVMAADVRAGRLCLSCSIVIENAAYKPVTTIHFADALIITGA